MQANPISTPQFSPTSASFLSSLKGPPKAAKEEAPLYGPHPPRRGNYGSTTEKQNSLPDSAAQSPQKKERDPDDPQESHEFDFNYYLTAKIKAEARQAKAASDANSAQKLEISSNGKEATFVKPLLSSQYRQPLMGGISSSPVQSPKGSPAHYDEVYSPTHIYSNGNKGGSVAGQMPQSQPTTEVAVPLAPTVPKAPSSSATTPVRAGKYTSGNPEAATPTGKKRKTPEEMAIDKVLAIEEDARATLSVAQIDSFQTTKRLIGFEIDRKVWPFVIKEFTNRREHQDRLDVVVLPEAEERQRLLNTFEKGLSVCQIAEKEAADTIAAKVGTAYEYPAPGPEFPGEPTLRLAIAAAVVPETRAAVKTDVGDMGKESKSAPAEDWRAVHPTLCNHLIKVATSPVADAEEHYRHLVCTILEGRERSLIERLFATELESVVKPKKHARRHLERLEDYRSINRGQFYHIAKTIIFEDVWLEELVDRESIYRAFMTGQVAVPAVDNMEALEVALQSSEVEERYEQNADANVTAALSDVTPLRPHIALTATMESTPMLRAVLEAGASDGTPSYLWELLVNFPPTSPSLQIVAKESNSPLRRQQVEASTDNTPTKRRIGSGKAKEASASAITALAALHGHATRGGGSKALEEALLGEGVPSAMDPTSSEELYNRYSIWRDLVEGKNAIEQVALTKLMTRERALISRREEMPEREALFNQLIHMEEEAHRTILLEGPNELFATVAVPYYKTEVLARQLQLEVDRNHAAIKIQRLFRAIRLGLRGWRRTHKNMGGWCRIYRQRKIIEAGKRYTPQPPSPQQKRT